MSVSEQFEVMPFALAGQEREQYLRLDGIGNAGRSRMGRGMAGRSMGSGAVPRQTRRLAPAPLSAQSGWPRYPRWGWPYRTGMAYPEPYWYRQPVAVPFEPEPFPADWAAEPPAEESKPLPPGMRQVINNMDKGGTLPKYRWRGTVASIVKRLPQEGCAGLYLLVFGPKGREQIYSGESENLRRRLLQHQRFGAVLGRDISNVDVFIHPMPGKTKEDRRALEKAVNASGIDLKVLTNRQEEFEGGVVGAT